MPKHPEIRFFVSKFVNLFYHLSVIFSEYFSDEESLGILNNAAYKETNAGLRTERLHRLFQSLQERSFYAWDFAGLSVFEADTMVHAREALLGASQQFGEIWLDIYSESLSPYEEKWAEIEPKLREYARRFEKEWNSVNDLVLSRMSNIAKRPWKPERINVHLVDCVNGASAWSKDIVLPPFPNGDVEKKLLAHELAHILVPDYFLKPKLQYYALDYSIAHTIVDLIAYFGIKEHVTEPERRGIKPNPNYYVQVDKLYPIFEDCHKYPDKYVSFDEILKQIVSSNAQKRA